MSLRANELETLFTANVDQLEKADKRVKEIADRVEKNPIEQKVTADTKNAVDGMDRVEAKAKTLVSRETAMSLDIKVANAENNLDRTKKRIELLKLEGEAGIDVKANLARAEADLSKMERNLEKLRTARTSITVEAPADDAIKSMDRVEKRAKELVSKEMAVRINAETTRAEQNVGKLEANLRVLRTLEPTPRVNVDIAYAEKRLDTARARLRDLEGARATMVVDVNDGGAEQKLRDVADYAEEAGADGGERGGKAMGAGIMAGIIALPIIGALRQSMDGLRDVAFDILVGDGMASLASADRLGALTGLDEAQAARMARSAAEAYASNFGESIEANMDTSRLALQFDLIDPNASVRSSQQVVQGLAGIADVLGEDVRPVATAVTTLLKTGMAANAQEAFDILAAGQREGVNRGEDLLDTFTEYPSVLKRLGLTGSESLGLMNQALDAGARNSDVAADALKEFQIRATDGAESSIKGFQRLGLNGERMTAKIARGGQDARDGLQEVLDKLRETEDPVVRNAAAVELFGTKAEDLGEALFAMDLTTAVDQLDGVTGAAQRMFDRLAQSDEAKLEQAGRNIEVGVEGIKATLAAGFADPLTQAADWINENRGPMLDFLRGLVEGTISFGITGANAIATISETTGELLGGPLAGLLDVFAQFAELTGEEQVAKDLRAMSGDMRDFRESTAEGAEAIRSELIPEMERGRDIAMSYMDGAIAFGYLNDASVRLADSLSQVGIDGEGAAISLDGVDTANLKASESGRLLEEQVRNAVSALGEEVSAAATAGETQAQLKERYDATTGALMGQLTQMGLSEEQARSLIDEILRTPSSVSTTFGSNADAQKAGVQSLADRITTLPDGTVVVYADTTPAGNAVESLISRYTGNTISLRVDGTPVINGVPQVGRAHGGGVFGPGTETSDSIPARLSHNEHVWTAAETRGAGGHAEVERLRRYAKAGRLGDILPGFRNGGPVLERYIGAPPAAITAGTALAAAPSGTSDPLTALAAAVVTAMAGPQLASAGAEAPLLGSLTLVSSGSVAQDMQTVRDELRILRHGGPKKGGPRAR